MSRNSQSEVQGGTDPKLQMEALIGEMRRMMKADMDQLHERMDRMENINRGQQQIPLNGQRRERAAQRPAEHYIEEFNEEYDDEDYDRHSVGNNRRFGRDKRNRNRENDHLGSIKMKILSFQGKNDPEVFWSGRRK